MSIAASINRMMICHDMTPAQLSELSGVSKANLNKYLTGKYKPAQDVLERIAGVFGCGIAELNKSNVQLFDKKGKVTVAAAAKMLGETEQTIRIQMQQKIIDIGSVYKQNPRSTHYTYRIDADKLNAEIKRREQAREPLEKHFKEIMNL